MFSDLGCPLSQISNYMSEKFLRGNTEFGKRRMEHIDWSGESRWRLEEQAKEELEMLETLYPNRFEYLKVDLKSFVLLVQSQEQHSAENKYSPHLSISSIAATQESTSLKQRKNNDGNNKLVYKQVCAEGETEEVSEPECHHMDAPTEDSCFNVKIKRRNRVDLVLDKARVCLKKIRRLKTSLNLSD